MVMAGNGLTFVDVFAGRYQRISGKLAAMGIIACQAFKMLRRDEVTKLFMISQPRIPKTSRCNQFDVNDVRLIIFVSTLFLRFPIRRIMRKSPAGRHGGCRGRGGWRKRSMFTPTSRETTMTVVTLACAALGVLFACLQLASTPAAAQTFTSFPLSSPHAPARITAGPDGNVWFTDPGQNSGDPKLIGQIACRHHHLLHDPIGSLTSRRATRHRHRFRWEFVVRG